MANPLLQVENLRTYFYTGDGIVQAVDDVSFHINKGETLCIVGESGCGKSVTAMSILQLIQMPPGKIEPGSKIVFEGEDLLGKSKSQIRQLRGCKISMIFQEVMTSLNPVLKIGRQISEAIELHQGLNAHEARAKTIEYLKLVGIPNSEKRFDEYPYQLSGGMRQRVMIAMATVCNPQLIIADEPTTALDVTIQAQVLDLILDLKDKLGTAILLITHDLGLVAETAERVIVMYAGKIVEEALVNDLFDDPRHPYTKGLLSSIPRIDLDRERLSIIKGVVPRPTEFPKGCRFNPRCEYVKELCIKEEPPLISFSEGRRVSCWLGTAEYEKE
jgi:oligopeptide/dipeptide ABC transporter ATP-binding protein